MLGGVPIVPLILIGGLTLLMSVWLYYLVSGYVSLALVLITIPIVLWMRQTTKTDDQRLRQVMIRARMRLRHGPSRATWGAISYGPCHGRPDVHRERAEVLSVFDSTDGTETGYENQSRSDESRVRADPRE